MEYRYNIYDLKNIHKLIIDRKIELARIYLEEYKTKYDSSHVLCKRYDAFLKAYEGYIEEAIEIFKENLLVDSDKYSNSDDAYYLVILLIKEGRYEEAYSYIKYIDFKQLVGNTKVAFKNATRIVNFLNKVLNKDGDVYDLSVYQELQSYDYSLDRAIEHILSNHNISKRDNRYSFYFSREKLSEIFNIINQAILISDKTFDMDFGDIYIFKVKDIGYNPYTDEHTDYLKVITLPNEHKITTMYPIEYSKYNNWSINELSSEVKAEYTSGKVRTRKSQIDKFNNRYQKQNSNSTICL